jgi:hypothetical protein
MNMSNIFDELKNLKDQESKRPCYIYLDEQTNEIKEKKLSDMAASALINNTVNLLKLIHDSIFH